LSLSAARIVPISPPVQAQTTIVPLPTERWIGRCSISGVRSETCHREAWLLRRGGLLPGAEMILPLCLPG